MKYNCSNEFDLKEIYRKLTSPSQPLTVKASEFFAPITFDEFQQRMELVRLNSKQTTTTTS